MSHQCPALPIFLTLFEDDVTEKFSNSKGAIENV
jgi:hypothetical protein